VGGGEVVDVDRVGGGLRVLGGHGVHCVSPPLLAGGSGGVGREVLDAIGAESGPVVGVRDHDGGLEVAQGHDVVAGVDVGGEVDELVGDASLVEGLDGGAALHAPGLGVDGDGHVGCPFGGGARLPRGD